MFETPAGARAPKLAALPKEMFWALPRKAAPRREKMLMMDFILMIELVRLKALRLRMEGCKRQVQKKRFNINSQTD